MIRHAAAPYHREVAGGQRPSHHDSPNEETNKYSMNKWPIPTLVDMYIHTARFEKNVCAILTAFPIDFRNK